MYGFCLYALRIDLNGLYVDLGILGVIWIGISGLWVMCKIGLNGELCGKIELWDAFGAN